MTHFLSVALHRLVVCAALLLPLASMQPAGRADEPLVRQLGDALEVELSLTPKPHFVIRGLALRDAQQAQDLVSFSVDSSQLEQPPAILGRYRLAEKRLEFHPQFPLQRSLVYRVKLSKELLSQPVDQSQLLFSLPDAETLPAPAVTAIYPTADELPENLLKFYVHFSQPMNRGEAYQRIHLFEGETRVDEPFLELGEELWNAQQTRFTLFIHPGRIKRGVQPRELKGPPLNSGKRYTLRIDAAWSSATGAPLPAAVEKNFTVTAPRHEQLDPLRWRIETPQAGSRQPVGLTFDAPLDQAMLSRVLEVKFNDDSPVAGTFELRDHETRWLFTPNDPWRVGAHRIEVLTNLEDLCGNSIAAPFEVKMELGATETPPAKVTIAFIVK